MPLFPAVLRLRRRTLKYAFFGVIGLYIAYRWLFDMPLLSSKLPKYSGQYDVGLIDVEVPVENRRRVAEGVFKSTGEPAFELETVLFSLYYPAVKDYKSGKERHPWVSKPLALTGEGYARFARMNNRLANKAFTFGVWALTGSTMIPAEVDAPIVDTVKNYDNYELEHPIDDYGKPTFPLIVFSHGMASSRTSYTQYCGELASRGFVVAAIEHRDGSGPGTLIMNNTTEPRHLFHFAQDSLDPKPEVGDFKIMQLAMRQAEVEETVKVLRMINDGEGGVVFRRNARKEGEDLAAWRGRLNTERIIFGGHSYGATLALQVLKGAPSEKFPFVGGMAFDPGKHSGPLNDDISVPIVIVHSQSWSAKHSIFHGRPHFDVVKDIATKIIEEKKRFAWFLTARGTTHPSVTDAPLIEPFLLSWTTGSTMDPRMSILQYVKVTRQFMRYLEDGHRQSILREEPTHPEYDKEKYKCAAVVSTYFQIHVAPTRYCPAPKYCGMEDGDDMDWD